MIFQKITIAMLALIASLVVGLSSDVLGDEKPDRKPSPIKKIGTIDLHLVETAPVVFKDKLYRFESVRPQYHHNNTGKAYFRYIDVETGEATPAFAEGHALGSTYAEGDKIYAFGTPGWGASKVNVFVSTDMKTWEQHQAFDLKGWELFNTSVCKADGQYIMAFEVGGPEEVAGQRFTGRFAKSKDLLNWELIPEPAVYTKEKYSACPTIRWSDGWYYMSYLNALGGYSFATEMVRSKDLATWEDTKRGPVLMFDKRDKKIANKNFTSEQIDYINGALNRNNSDIDYTEFEGKVIIYYSWGDQAGKEFLNEAHFDGTLKEFFAYYFPEK